MESGAEKRDTESARTQRDVRAHSPVTAMLPFILFAVFAVVAMVLLRVYRKSEQSAALGTMSEKWLAENRASRH